MHRCCGDSQGHMMGTCTCTMLHIEHEVYSSYMSSPFVDCTLSLGTPSTRFTEGDELRKRHEPHYSVTNFCWDLLQSTTSSIATSTKTFLLATKHLSRMVMLTREEQ
ncbi:hypothetical protein LR48_Vigan05g151900 [Vigna angularis]|uniref:Uncharacterized protein n=1 Tax=Phaseolus angularis TaxID=3914 RepID=A0A0L9UMZ3_PHAAN|nr:hypothetical protein LR48_Vigan05g151900 [Vigna angularis]